MAKFYAQRLLEAGKALRAELSAANPKAIEWDALLRELELNAGPRLPWMERIRRDRNAFLKGTG